MSFRWKIILGLAAIQAILMVFIIWGGLTILTHTSEKALLERTTTTTQLFASTAQAAVIATDLASLESYVQEVMSNPGVVYARVRGKSGVLAEKGSLEVLNRDFRSDLTLASATASDKVFDAKADILVAGEKYGQVEIGFSTVEIHRLIAKVRNQSLLMGAVGMLIMSFFSWGLAHYLTRSLSTLQNATRQVAQGALGYQIKVSGQDELAATALAFNEMSGKLKQLDQERQVKQQEIHKLNLELEQRVVERTHQLEQANQRLEHQALHDALTMLPNRTLFRDRLQNTLSSAKRTREPFAIIGVDLDLFKEINDSLGHHAGDLVLQHVSQACRKALRDSDTVARMGGDEFAILMPQVKDMDNALHVAQRTLAAIREPLQLGERMVEIGASLGIALFPQHGDEEDILMNHSDIAMYEAKRNKSGVVVYQPEMGETSTEAMVLKSELRHAIESHQMVLHFQPKVDFGSQRVNGAEALVRWDHPRLGLLYPDKFIHLAESSGLIKLLTREVLRLALVQVHAWFKQSYELPLAVNISAINLQDRGFPEWVAGMLAEHEVPSRLLELEVTETAIMTEPIIAIENIRKLATMGVQVSIDDFGTGYSSMAYLQKLLVAKIKIDKSFVQDMGLRENDEVIVRSTIDLAHNLGLKAVAEGVESEASWEKLRALGCDSAQGYYMSKPLTPEKFMEWIQGSPWGTKLPLATGVLAAESTGTAG